MGQISLKERLIRLKDMGYRIKTICNALSISRSRYYRIINKPQRKAKADVSDMLILDKIKAIIKGHPFWGYRRITAWLRHRENCLVNRKKVYRLMKENGLTNKQINRKNSRVTRPKPRASKPNEIWGIDMTKFLIPGLGWVYLEIIIDWFTKKIIAWDVDLRSRSAEWRQVLNQGVMNEFVDGSRDKGVKLVSDNGSQPTSRSFIKDCKALGIEQIFTSYNNPKGNADTERVIRTLKEEIIWINEWNSLEETRDGLKKGIYFYNNQYPHSTLGYLSPVEFEKKYQETIQKVA